MHSFKDKHKLGKDPHDFFPSPLPTPAYVQVESQLRANLERIKSVADQTGVEIILAFKAYALWKVFPIFREYISCSTASSLNEARMGLEKMGNRTHTYAPIYKDSEFDEMMRCSSHIVFNTPKQFEKFYPRVKAYTDYPIECGIRINPEYSEIETDLYNPAAPGSRMGTILSQMPEKLPEGVTGLHFHVHCESSSYELERSLRVISSKFDHLLRQVKWLNMGGGHLMTRQDYDIDHLIKVLNEFKSKYPHLHIILEPGSAFAWETGYLVTRIEDIVENHGISTLMMDASFTCHMPDCLEMPYQPAIRGASKERTEDHKYGYRIGGNSCLSGDVMGDWYFKEAPEIGDLLIFEDMVHYTTVKTNMFNGIHHPSLYLERMDGSMELMREYSFEDYLNRMC